jgi:hypothetical protein
MTDWTELDNLVSVIEISLAIPETYSRQFPFYPNRNVRFSQALNVA